MKTKEWAWNNLVAVDQLANTVLFGYPDETLSSRAYRKAAAGQWFWRAVRHVIDMVFFFQPHHCREAYRSEYLGLHSSNEVRKSNG